MEQDWIFGLFGGLMIGAAGAVFLLVNGKILGASGIIGGLVDGTGHDTIKERLSFLAGLVIAPFILTFLWVRPDTHISDNLLLIAGAGLLVGIGSRMANGCTSGHGVCGISRLSFRGIAATLAYLTAGGVTMLFFRHLLGVI